MAFQLSSINEVITPEVFESLKATIEAKKNQKAPSAALPRRAPASVPAEQLKLINELLDTSYENSDWLVYAQSSQGLDGMGISRSELLSVRIATSVALSLAEDSQTADALAALITWINKHPTFGDLYLGLAGLKLRASQIDAARQLVELAELCPRYHKNGVANMKKKIELLLPECTFRPFYRGIVNFGLSMRFWTSGLSDSSSNPLLLQGEPASAAGWFAMLTYVPSVGQTANSG